MKKSTALALEERFAKMAWRQDDWRQDVVAKIDREGNVLSVKRVLRFTMYTCVLKGGYIGEGATEMAAIKAALAAKGGR